MNISMIKNKRYFVWLGLISYFLIILRGDMIGIPFIFWILFSLSEFGEVTQIFALSAVLGIIFFTLKLSNYKPKIKLLFRLLAVIMMLSPILWKLAYLPLSLFNYSNFITPALIFIAISLAIISSDFVTIYKTKEANTG